MLQEMFLSFMKKFEDRMMKTENRMKENWREMGNRIIENGLEVLTSTTTGMQQRTNQGTEFKKEEIKISVCTHDHIQTLSDTVQCDKSESFEAQIKHQSNSCHSEEDVISRTLETINAVNSNAMSSRTLLSDHAYYINRCFFILT
jgi:hypothetical protein